MFYSDDEDDSPQVSRKAEIDRKDSSDNSKTFKVGIAEGYGNEAQDDGVSMFGVPDSPKPTSRPQSGRAVAQKKALAMQEKRKQMRTASMVVASDTPPRPSSASTPRRADQSPGASPQTERLFKPRTDVQDLIKERTNKVSEAEKDLQMRGLSSTFDPTELPEVDEKEEKNQGSSQKEEPLPKIGKSPTVVEKVLATNTKPELDLSDLRDFVFRPAPKGSIVQCRIEREKGGDKIHNNFYVYLDDGRPDPPFLLCARKRKKSKSSNYLFSTNKDDLSRKGRDFIGKLRSNFMGTEFVFYDDGESPEKAATSGSAIRKELGAVCYSYNVVGVKGPRKMRVVLPTPEDPSVVFQPTKTSESIIEKFKANDFRGMALLQNKSPVWNEQTKSFMLNFRNRVKQASVKNFQVVSQEDTESILMQFGRVSDTAFTMDYSYPLNLFQAFSISLTSFDNKLACQ